MDDATSLSPHKPSRFRREKIKAHWWWIIENPSDAVSENFNEKVSVMEQKFATLYNCDGSRFVKGQNGFGTLMKGSRILDGEFKGGSL